MTDPRLIGIDLGTSGARITAYNTQGDIILSRNQPIERQTVEEWERALQEETLSLTSDRTICSVDGTSGTVVPVDGTGTPVFEPRMYYEAAPEQGERVTALPEAEALAERGVSLSATSPLSKILQLREEHPDRFEEIEWILSPSVWLLNRLKHREKERWRDLRTDWTNALKFGADITTPDPEWFAPLFEAVDLPLDLFPDIEPPGTFVGVASSDLADDIGLDGAELYQGMTDGNASVLAAGCLEPGDYSITCGSTSVVKYVSESIRPHDALYYHRHPIEGYVPGAAFETGVILRWFCTHVLDLDQEQGLGLAKTVDPGDEYEVFIQGNRSPFFDSGMGNSFLGIWPENELSTPEVRGRFVRGIASGIALAEYTYLPLIEDHFATRVEHVSLVGGGTPGGDDPFSWWNQLRASVWDRTVTQMESRTTIGPVITAALSTGLFDDVQEASDVLLRANGRLTPDDHLRDAYASRREDYKDRWREVHSLYASRPDAGRMDELRS